MIIMPSAFRARPLGGQLGHAEIRPSREEFKNYTWEQHEMKNGRKFKVGDRFLINHIRIAHDVSKNIYDTLNEINIIETSELAIKTQEYGWLLREWEVKIIETLNLCRGFLTEKIEQ